MGNIVMQEYKRKIEPDEVEEFPVFLYRGEVIVVDRPEQVATAVADLRDHAVLGFDTETKPSFKKGVVHQVGLLQLASKERVYLFRLNKCGLPYSLRELLVNEDVLKVGVGIRDDIRALRKMADFLPASFVDLQLFVKAFGIEEMSFSKLMSIVFGVKISKRQRTSNWEAPVLTTAQIRYAATDAWGALRMYEALRSGEKQNILLC
ncbi:3'-5' exonuclease [Gabonibacter chumensis]|uniref:3'-5' exonuclease n=1 Tax=Gabonibacter chumensis TaxID=2972474 RepID=UPI002572ED3D|nr:3'-5' exonuclease [Gabonibacter chumensis]MCR9012895.1 3'-5' exonuclease domain-containing protein 2 [Gabonibacter chumensis]